MGHKVAHKLKYILSISLVVYYTFAAIPGFAQSNPLSYTAQADIDYNGYAAPLSQSDKDTLKAAESFANSIEASKSKTPRQSDYDYTAADPFTAALEAQTGVKSGAAGSQGDNAICNAADFAGQTGNGMAALEGAFKAFNLPSMIMQMACPKKTTDTTKNEIMPTFTNPATGGQAQPLQMMMAMLAAMGGMMSMLKSLSGGDTSQMMGFAMGALGGAASASAGGGDPACAAMAGILGALAGSGNFFNPGIAGLMNGGGGGSGGGGTGPTMPGGGGGGVGKCNTSTGSALSIKDAVAKAKEMLQKHNIQITGAGLEEDAIVVATFAGKETNYVTKLASGGTLPNYAWNGSPRSSAAGMLQMLSGTAQNIYDKYGSKHNLPALQTSCFAGHCEKSLTFEGNPDVAIAYGALLMQENYKGSGAFSSTSEDFVMRYHGGPGWKNCGDPNGRVCKESKSYYSGWMAQYQRVKNCLSGNDPT